MADLSVTVNRKAAEGHESARRERDRRAIKTGAVGVAVQVLNHGIRLLVIPLSISMLGVEQYGLFLVVGALVAWGGATDLGLAPGLINVVATAHGRGDREEMRRAISTAFAAYGLIAILVILLTVAASRWDSLPALLGVRTPELADSARTLTLVCGLIFAGLTATRVTIATAKALQEGQWVSYSYLAANLAGLLVLVAMASAGGGLLAYSLVVCLPTLLAQLALTAYLFQRRYPDLRPALSCVDRSSLRVLSGYAGPLTVYQLANLAILYSANILIAARLGAKAVPGFSVPYAAFATLVALAWLAVSPYLPAYAEASARKDWAWIQRRNLQIAGLSALLVAAGGLALVLIGPALIKWYTHGAIEAGQGLLWALLFFAIVRVVGNTTGVYLMGIGRLRTVAAAYTVAAVFFAAGAWWLLPRIGLIAVPLACGAGHLGVVWAGWGKRA